MSQTRSGYRSSAGGLVGALIVSLGLIAAVGLMTFLQARDTGDPAPAYDYASDLQAARDQSPFAVLAPARLPDGWYATSADWIGAGPENSWHLGVLTDAGDYVGLEQGNAIAAHFIEDHTRASAPGDPVQIDGQTWQTLTSGSETALVLAGDGVTTLVTGTAPEADLVAYAKSLATQ